MIKKYRKLICLFMFISMSFGLICHFLYTVPNEYKHKDDCQCVLPEVSLVNHFDYFNGVFLIGDVLFLVFLLILFDAPSFKDIYIRLKKDLKYKINEAKSFKKGGR